jgi:hypothetical protein
MVPFILGLRKYSGANHVPNLTLLPTVNGEHKTSANTQKHDLTAGRVGEVQQIFPSHRALLEKLTVAKMVTTLPAIY